VKPTLHSQVHEWRERSEEGRLRIVRAQWDSKKWTFTETYKDLPNWQNLTAPTVEDYAALRDVLWRKYQRKRVPWRFIEELDALIEERRAEPS
jgi:hypothetical protein